MENFFEVIKFSKTESEAMAEIELRISFNKEEISELLASGKRNDLVLAIEKIKEGLKNLRRARDSSIISSRDNCERIVELLKEYKSKQNDAKNRLKSGKKQRPKYHRKPVALYNH